MPLENGHAARLERAERDIERQGASIGKVRETVTSISTDLRVATSQLGDITKAQNERDARVEKLQGRLTGLLIGACGIALTLAGNLIVLLLR